MKYKYNDKLTKEQNLLCERLQTFKASKMAEALAVQFSNPNYDLAPFMERITEIISAEWDYRYNKKFNKFAKEAALKYPDADFDNSIYDPERILDTKLIERLQTCSWIDEKKNLIVSGSSGAGKTYLINALCICACRKFYSTRYERANKLILDFEHLRATDSVAYKERMDKLVSYDLLVIDDFGLMNLDLDKCRDLFELVESRDHYKSTVFASQLPFSSWYDLFKQQTYADACIRRIVPGAYRLEMNGKDMTPLT